jgi:2-C-methyl-D-erythritol 4-phosphate cytidylyltransferase / 2-C-methyl-D-erythritol 2,4-cyclodiphosphate synthase
MIINDAILLGGGVGRRFFEVPSDRGTLPKQFQLLADAPVFIHSLRALLALGCLRQILVIMPKPYLGLAREQLSDHLPDPSVPIQIAPGGERRQDSSRLALDIIERTSPLPTRVLIHDACRPFLSTEMLFRIKTALFDRSYGAWIPAIPVIETLKKVENHQVVETVDRSIVQRVQTPQVFEYGVIRSLAEKTKDLREHNFTDDASLCEYYGIPVGVFEGDVRNLKLTYEFELRALQSMITQNKDTSCELDSATTFTV